MNRFRWLLCYNSPEKQNKIYTYHVLYLIYMYACIMYNYSIIIIIIIAAATTIA